MHKLGTPCALYLLAMQNVCQVRMLEIIVEPGNITTVIFFFFFSLRSKSKGEATSNSRLNSGASQQPMPAKLLSTCPKYDTEQLKLRFKRSLPVQGEELGCKRETFSP